MSIAAFSIADEAIAETRGTSRGKRPPSTRLVIAKPDSRVTPEPR